MNEGYLLLPALFLLTLGLAWIQDKLVRMKHWLPGLLLPLILLTIAVLIVKYVGTEQMNNYLASLGLLHYRWIVETSAPQLFAMASTSGLYQYWSVRCRKKKRED